MDANRVTIAALLFIIVIIFINFAMFIIARSWAQSGESRWMAAIRKSLSKSMESPSSKSREELRQKMEELRGNHKEEK